MKATRGLALLALALPFATAAAEPAARHGAPAPALAEGDCPRHETGPARLRFSHYPAVRRVGTWAAPVLASREARLHRSTIGAEVANGPNFAGDYTLAAWGCGNACTQVAIVAARTGRIFFPAQLRRIGTDRVGTWDGGRALRYRGLRFCRDSRLLAVVGRTGASDGASYFEWTGTALREIPVAPGAPHPR